MDWRLTNNGPNHFEKYGKYFGILFMDFSRIQKITEEEYDQSKIEPFLFQIKLFTNFIEEEFNFFMDKIAYSIQHPEDNIKFGTLVISDYEGAGKSFVWKILFKLYGGLD